ncbi:MAG: thiol peroxidase [Ardenticatenaceae bacterium]
MSTERAGGTTFQGNPLTVIGDKLNVGDQAPDFALVGAGLSTVTLADSAGKVRLINVVPSLDTGVCSMQTKRFNDEVASFGDKVVMLGVSADLPFAQGRWCQSNEANSVQSLSDHRDMSFGDAYGTHIKELRLEQRSVFVVDENDTIQYAEYVDEVVDHPDYDAALGALKEAVGA